MIYQSFQTKIATRGTKEIPSKDGNIIINNVIYQQAEHQQNNSFHQAISGSMSSPLIFKEYLIFILCVLCVKQFSI